MAITIKNQQEIELMRQAGHIVALAHARLESEIQPGMTTQDLDDIVRDVIEEHGAIPTFLGHMGFTGRICASINEEIVHGIPGKKTLREGDIIAVDIGATYHGFIGDSAWTYPVGAIDETSQRLLDVTEKSLYLGIEQAVAGNRLGDIGHAIEQFVTGQGYGMVREYGGHGVGRQMWEEPHVPNHGQKGTGVLLREGMTIAIEPMVNIGGDETLQLEDGWTVITRDRTRSAHFEHTILIRNGPPEILTKRVERVV
ncbi:MAG: type I methionyl aminopeptidase [Thermomicrobiales bacterium]|nr:type I methionyl aminopeptidase [Thermomicrobiales bacterium]